MSLLICVPTESLTNHSIQNQVVLFRTESNRARGVLQQLRLVFLYGLAYRLHAISAQIGETRLRIEVRQITLLPIIQLIRPSQLVVDEQRLASVVVV
jgi:hypothetical protein